MMELLKNYRQEHGKKASKFVQQQNMTECIIPLINIAKYLNHLAPMISLPGTHFIARVAVESEYKFKARHIVILAANLYANYVGFSVLFSTIQYNVISYIPSQMPNKGKGIKPTV